uniref:CCDC81 HU domain-containing protein n=1 Tax=Hucho hucho TaxID=62062 RepID=A0A4W5QRM7_9TELE
VFRSQTSGLIITGVEYTNTRNVCHPSVITAGDVPVVQLNFTALSVESPFERHVVEGCVRETLLVLLRAVAAGRSVLFTFYAIGELLFCQSKVKMKFYHCFVTALDGSGKLLLSLSNRPGTSNSLLFGRSSIPGTSNTIILPRISSEQRGKDWGEEALAQVQTDSDRKEENRGEGETVV